MQNNFEKLISPVLYNENYLQLNNYQHHNTTRLNHSYNVAVYSYRVGLKLSSICHVDFEALLTGALLHDFYFVQQKDKSIKRCWFHHCNFAKENAEQYFSLSEKEKNIILAHMFPLAKMLPHSKEAWIVNLMDKFSAFMEACFHKNFPIPGITNIEYAHATF